MQFYQESHTEKRGFYITAYFTAGAGIAFAPEAHGTLTGCATWAKLKTAQQLPDRLQPAQTSAFRVWTTILWSMDNHSGTMMPG
jgi:hypothetical protein